MDFYFEIFGLAISAIVVIVVVFYIQSLLSNYLTKHKKLAESLEKENKILKNNLHQKQDHIENLEYTCREFKNETDIFKEKNRKLRIENNRLDTENTELFNKFSDITPLINDAKKTEELNKKLTNQNKRMLRDLKNARNRLAHATKTAVNTSPA